MSKCTFSSLHLNLQRYQLKDSQKGKYLKMLLSLLNEVVMFMPHIYSAGWSCLISIIFKTLTFFDKLKPIQTTKCKPALVTNTESVKNVHAKMFQKV